MVMSRSPSSSGSRSVLAASPGSEERRQVVGAALRSGEEWPLEVQAQRLGAIGRGVGQPRADALGEAASAGSGADTAVGRKDVTPRRSSARAIPSRAARSPIASWPPQPWTWTST